VALNHSDLKVPQWYCLSYCLRTDHTKKRRISSALRLDKGDFMWIPAVALHNSPIQDRLAPHYT